MRKIILTGKRGPGKYALVDDDIFEKANKYSWHIETTGYPARSYRINYKRFNELLHHFVIGKPSNGFVVDHINRNKLDNRKQNLRFISYGQNIVNSNLRTDNTSGHTGVRVVVRNNRTYWQAYGSENGKQKHLGYFKNRAKAILVRESWAKSLFKS